MMQNTALVKILLADDDEDDRLFFSDAFKDLKINSELLLFRDGIELMDYLNVTDDLPHILFLDLNMPKKSGFECLQEIRADQKLRELSVAIYSTSSSDRDIEETFVKGANVYIKKPSDFNKLKKIIHNVVYANWQYVTSGLNRDTFLLNISE